VKGGTAVTRWYFKQHFVFFGKKRAAFKWKDAISGFPVSPGSAEALVGWGGKIKYVLIAYFLGNNIAKIVAIFFGTVYVKIIASQRWDVFLDTVYSCVHVAEWLLACCTQKSSIALFVVHTFSIIADVAFSSEIIVCAL